MDARPDAAFRERLAELGAGTLGVLAGLEAAARQLDPQHLAQVRAGIAPAAGRLRRAVEAFRAEAPPGGLEGLARTLGEGADRALAAAEGLAAPDPASPVAGVLDALRQHARAQEILYPLRAVLPPLGRYFTEPPLWPRLAELDPEPPQGVTTGLHRAGGGQGARARGGFSLYVPERYDGGRALPLVVALHGGGGHGADFLWTWLREARSRQVLLLAPTSRGSTWALHAPPLDAAELRRMVAFVMERWRVDAARVLLTGLSDGATFTLLAGLAEDAPYTHLAPVSGVLHPLCFVGGSLERAAGRPVYLVHGARDWMFPVDLARAARDALAGAGAALVYREIEDLSHTYPREENARILRWLAPALALPGEGQTPDEAGAA